MRYGRYIVATPDVQFGRPRLRGCGVSVVCILERRLAGESVAELAEDYDTTEAHIRAADRYVFDLLNEATVT